MFVVNCALCAVCCVLCVASLWAVRCVLLIVCCLTIIVSLCVCVLFVFSLFVGRCSRFG